MQEEKFSLRKIAIPAFGPSILFGAAEGAIYPVIPTTSTSLGASLALASLIVSIIGIGSLLANVPASLFTFKYGEKKAIIGASLISATAMALFLYVHNLIIFIIANLMVGIAQSVFNLARQAYLTEVVPVDMRATALSTLGGSMRIGVFIGPFIGAATMNFMGIKGAYVVGLVVSLGALAIAVFLPDLHIKRKRVVNTEKTTFKYIFKDNLRVFATIGIGILAVSAVRASRQVIIPLWGHYIGLDPKVTSMIYGISGAIDMLLFYPAGKVMDRFGRRWVSIPAMLIMTVGFIIMPFTHSAGMLTIAALLLGFGNGVSSGLVMTLGADYSPAEGRAKFLGIWRFLQDFGSSAGPLIISGLTALISLGAGISSAGILGIVAASVLGYWTPILAKEKTEKAKAARKDKNSP
ncbi:MAG: MFS transporter [Micrococcaceae bacterium]